jgi:REP element-mobilizing transposase RayT
MHDVWTIMEDYLHFIVHAYGVQIHAFMLMNNHIHLLISAPLNNLSEAMNYFMRETSRCISRSAGRVNQTYGGRYHRSLLKSHHYYLHAYKYLYRNPVEAGIVARPEAYRYSTLPGLLGLQALRVPLVEDLTLFDSVEETLSWINTCPHAEDREAVRRALKRLVFALPNEPSSLKEHRLEHGLY